MRIVARIVVGVLAVVGLAALAATMGFARSGVAAKRQPSAFEVKMARGVRHRLVPAGARALKNPVALDDEVLSDGRAHFADHCATCHGNDGRGDTAYGRNLHPRAPDLTAAATQTLSDGELFYFIEQGIRFTGMPAFGTETPESERESWELVHFIRHLPRISPEELEEMKRFNPISRAELEEELAAEAFLRGEEPAVPKPPHEHEH